MKSAMGDLSSYSNLGTGVAITAPGGDFGELPGVISTLNGGITQPALPSYATYSGTSMTVPHVAGVVALVLTRDPTLTAGQVINRRAALHSLLNENVVCEQFVRSPHLLTLLFLSV